MTIRSRNESVVFNHPFRLKGIERLLPQGTYEVVSDDEMIEGLSFPCYRRVLTMIVVPGAPPNGKAMEMITISAIDLEDAQRNDKIASSD